jgi:hypothetical protein
MTTSHSFKLLCCFGNGDFSLNYNLSQILFFKNNASALSSLVFKNEEGYSCHSNVWISKMFHNVLVQLLIARSYVWF